MFWVWQWWRICLYLFICVFLICTQKNILNKKLRIISAVVPVRGTELKRKRKLIDEKCRGTGGDRGRQQTPRYINKHCCEQSGSRPHGESRMEEPARWKLYTSGRCFTMHVYIQVCVFTVLYVSVKNTAHCRIIQFSFGGSCDGRTWLTFGGCVAHVCLQSENG